MQEEREKIERLEIEIKDRKSLVALMKRDYLTFGRKFLDGDAVTVIAVDVWKNGGDGFISRGFLNDQLEIVYSVVKVKKDGLPSKVFMDYSGGYSANLINECQISKREIK